MTRRDPKERFDKITINLRKGDTDILAARFPQGYSWAIRQLVIAFVDRTETKTEQRLTEIGLDG